MSFAEELTFSPTLLEKLEREAESADVNLAWPAASWDGLKTTGALRWGIPQEYGGDELPPKTFLVNQEMLASACLTTTFLLSQRDAAIRRIREFGSEEVQRAVLPPLASGQSLIMVGLSQLTTSRQHRAPALLAVAEGTGYRLRGEIPWVSGASVTTTILAGAKLEDGRQILVLLPRQREGVEVDAPLPLASLRGSMTTQVRCSSVRIEREEVLSGPAERVLSGSKGAGGLETSCLALGLTRAALGFLKQEAGTRKEFKATVEKLQFNHDRTRELLHTLAEWTNAEAAATVRVRATRLALQSTQTALLAAKGTGFVHDHPAQRWARQALFFLVWSCPRPTSEGLLHGILADLELGFGS